MKMMEEYKKTLEKRVSLLIIVVVVAALIVTTTRLVDLKTQELEAMLGYHSGFMTGVALVALIQIGRLSKIMKDKDMMKQHYIEEHDERAAYIKQKAGFPMIWITSTAMLLIGGATWLISIQVFLALTIAGAAQLLFALLMYLYYDKKY